MDKKLNNKFVASVNQFQTFFVKYYLFNLNFYFNCIILMIKFFLKIGCFKILIWIFQVQ